MPKAPETAALPPFPEVTAHFENWLRSRIQVNEADLAYKHEQMDTGVFPFMRATFYRWMQLWPVLCPKLTDAPSVLAVGDLHVDNFGTWRDAEGRLIWGVNDFDEAYPLPYTLDLVRLAASIRMAIAVDRLKLTPRLACDVLLAGYRSAIERGGRPFVLAENHPVLRREASGVLRDPVRFWQGMTALPDVQDPPADAVMLLRAALPKDVQLRYVPRRAGLGSLGHPRFVALGEHHGGYIAREAKALAPSACIWAAGGEGAAIHYATIVRRAVRDADPFLQLRGAWVLRRLAPDCSRIVATTVQTVREQEELARAMGVEAANIHLGAAPSRVDELRRDLASRPEGWLRSASKTMARATQRDFESWRRRAPAAVKAASKDRASRESAGKEAASVART